MKKKVFIKVYDKKQLVLILSVVLLIVTSIMTSQFSKTDKKKLNPSVIEVSKPVSNINKNSAVEEIKLNREVERSKVVDQLKTLVEQTTGNNIKVIEDKISMIIDRSNKEMICENVICSKGIGEDVVLSSDNMVYVVVNKSLTKREVVQIQNIVMNIFGVKPNNIRITSLK